jgi:hypothetical protein
MKLIHLLTGSVTLNVALSIACCLRPAPRAPIAGPPANEGSRSPVQVVEKCVTNVITVTKGAEPFDWRTVESEDYRQYVANLRAIGCPEKTLRDIIMADLTDLFRQRAKRSTSNRFEYWKPGVFGNVSDEKRLAEQQKQAKERREILANLLGESYSDKADPAAGQIVSPMEQMTGDFLSPEKQASMKALEMKYAARMMKAAKDGGGEDSEALRKVMADKDAEMLTLLSPEDKYEYDLRLSQPAILLRMNMGEFEPTEAEFRELFNTTKKFTDKFGFGVITRLGNVRPGDGEVNEMLDGFKAVLGEDRFQQFQSQLASASGRK